MKRTLIALALVIVTTTSLVHSQALFDVPNASAEVSFYTDDPATGGHLLNTVRINNSPIAVRLDNLEAASHATIDFAGEIYTFVLANSGVDKTRVTLRTSRSRDGGGLTTSTPEEGTSLAEVMDALATDPAFLERLSEEEPAN